MNQEVVAKHTVNIQLLNKSFVIKCPIEKTQELQQIAHYLNEKMLSTRSRKHSASTEELTVLAAIEVIYELMQQLKDKDIYMDGVNDQIDDIQNRIALTLAENAQIEL